MKNISIIIAIIFLFVSDKVYADILFNVKIKHLYAQSTQGAGNAHLLVLEKTKVNNCSNGGLYITLKDKEIYASALAYYIANKTINIAYDPNSINKVIPPHTETKCKIFSLWAS